MVKIEYDAEFDILYIYKERKKVKFSIEALDNFVIDIGFDGNVVGLEIHNTLKTLKVSKSELKNLEEAKLATIRGKDFYGVIFGLRFKEVNLESELRVPITVQS